MGVRLSRDACCGDPLRTRRARDAACRARAHPAARPAAAGIATPVVPERRVLSVRVEPRVSIGRAGAAASCRAEDSAHVAVAGGGLAGGADACMGGCDATSGLRWSGRSGIRRLDACGCARPRGCNCASSSRQRSSIDGVSCREPHCNGVRNRVGRATPALAGVPASASDPMANGRAPEPTADIIELQRKAAAGDSTAIAHLNELGDFYAALASSAQARGDHAAATRHLAMAALMRSTSKPVENAVAPSNRTCLAPEPGHVSPVDALAQEAGQLQSQGAVFAPRNAMS